MSQQFAPSDSISLFLFNWLTRARARNISPSLSAGISALLFYTAAYLSLYRLLCWRAAMRTYDLVGRRLAKQLPPLIPHELLHFHLLVLGHFLEIPRAVDLAQLNARLSVYQRLPPALQRLVQMQLQEQFFKFIIYPLIWLKAHYFQWEWNSRYLHCYYYQNSTLLLNIN